MPAAEGSTTPLERLRAIGRYDLFNSGLRRELNELCARTAKALGMPASGVVLVLDSAQYAVGQHGVTGLMSEVSGTPVEWSFCQYPVASGQPYAVDDATRNAAHEDSPMVTRDGVRSYLGVPLHSPDGAVIGSHCVTGSKPHHFSEAEVARLQQLADEVMKVLSRYRK
jgi:GAF domain-containing protein